MNSTTVPNTSTKFVIAKKIDFDPVIYYRWTDGGTPHFCRKKDAARMDAEVADTVLEHLDRLGHTNLIAIQENVRFHKSFAKEAQQT